jgi:hypothetical protein
MFLLKENRRQGFRVFNIFRMSKEKDLITSYHDVMPAVANLLAKEPEKIYTRTSCDMQDIFERFMETEYAI